MHHIWMQYGLTDCKAREFAGFLGLLWPPNEAVYYIWMQWRRADI
jgi:hypothetical protein